MKFFEINRPNITPSAFKKSLWIIFILSFVIFGKSIWNEYAMDDEYVTLNNPQIQKGIKAIPEIFRTSYANDKNASYEYRPIVKATYAIEYQFFGQSPHVSHFINVLSYAILTSFLFYTLLLIFESYNYLFSLAIAILFLVHPLHTEVVMSLKNRDVMLSFMGAMLSLYFYVKFADKERWINLVWGLFFLLFAFLSKKDAATFVAIIPLTIFFFRKLSLKTFLSIILSFLPAVIIFSFASHSVKDNSFRTMLLWENPLFIDSDFFSRIPTGIYTVGFYLKMFILPHPLISYYGYNQFPIPGYENILVWVIFIFLVVVLFFCFKNLKQKYVWVYGILYFLITISMFTNIVKPVVGIVAERFMFIPSLGLCILLVWAVFKYFKIPSQNLNMKFAGIKGSATAFFGIILFLFSIKSFSRNAAWKDELTLYETDVKLAKESAHTHSLLAAAYVKRIRETPNMSIAEKRSKANLAVKHYLESIRIYPEYVTSLSNLGMVYHSFLGSSDKALPYLEKAIKLDTGYTEAYFNLATSYAYLKRYDLAEKHYLKAIELNPKFLPAYQSISQMYNFLGQNEKIIEVNKVGISKGVKADLFYINIANAYILNKDTLSAIPFLEQAIELVPNNKGVNTFLSTYFEKNGNVSKSDYYKKLLTGTH